MPIILAVSRSAGHSFSKQNEPRIWLIEGLGVEGDAHAGITVRHRYTRRAAREVQPNLRQVHLIHAELFDELRKDGFQLYPGALGENITTRGVDLLNLPENTNLHIGRNAILKVTGLRTPCRQMDKFATRLSEAVMEKVDGLKKRRSRAGVMAVVINGGEIRPGDFVKLERPSGPAVPLRHV